AKPIAIALIVMVAWAVNRLVRWLIKRSVHRITDPARLERLERLRLRSPNVLVRAEEWNPRSEARTETITAVVSSLATIFIGFVALVAILDVVGINFGPLLAGAGIAGVALGF